MKLTNVLVKIGGKTGEGIDSSGEMLALIAKECGLEVNTFRSFPSVIKGGDTSYEVHMANRPVYSRGDFVHILFAFDQENMDQLHGELHPEGVVFYDPAMVGRVPEGLRVVAVPLSDMASELGSKIVRNMVALGIAVYLLDLDMNEAERIAALKFADKGEKVVSLNRQALQKGWAYARERLGAYRLELPRGSRKEKLFLSGNEAMALGALAADCMIFAGYPITPATDIMEWLALRLPQFGGTVVQTEDEIAALCMVIGANYAGVRAMTATSGPGISLMTEALGLAGMTETPAVIVNVQRPGPSAGMPTKHEQSDIKHMVHGSHGEFPRIVLAPGNVQECFEDIVSAFNLADRYQCPVIVASDQDLALRKQTVEAEAFDLEKVVIDRGELAAEPKSADGTNKVYKRYAFTESGISPRAFPGQEGLLFLASGDEHDDAGKIDVFVPEVRRAVMEKRMRKLNGFSHPGVRLHGPKDARGVIIGVGSTTGPILEVLNRMEGVKYLQLRRLWPFPAKEVIDVLEEAEWAVVVEHNATGQLVHLLKAAVPFHHKIKSVTKFDGTPFRPGELLKEVEQCLPTKIS